MFDPRHRSLAEFHHMIKFGFHLTSVFSGSKIENLYDIPVVPVRHETVVEVGGGKAFLASDGVYLITSTHDAGTFIPRTVLDDLTLAWMAWLMEGN